MIHGHLATEIKLEDSEIEINNLYKPTIYFSYVYSLNVWKTFNDKTGIRSGQNVVYGGIQLGANNMPQGELIQIPLNKNTGRQNQAHFYIHFEECSADLGRKGFQKDITNFAKSISRKILDISLQKLRKCFKKNTGLAPDLMREQNIDNWKQEMTQHELNNPIIFINENFFLPTNQISITSISTREQDVIALFNQLIAGGVIRGIKIMATNERFTYDGLYKVSILPPEEHHLYNEAENPLGIMEENVKEILQRYSEGFVSSPKVLEYKYTLDGLIEDVSTGLKNTNDIGLVVAWEAGELYKENFYITSLLVKDNIDLRQYHGITHILNDCTNEQRVCDLIILKDLLEYLNDSKMCEKNQTKYEM